MEYSPYFNPEIETMTTEDLKSLQLKRLKDTVNHCMNSAFYRDKFAELGITPDDIQTLDDVRRLPFTTKEDLRTHYPFGLACVPLRECTRLHSSSGTTGNPTVVLHTQKDLEEWANAVARCLWMVGSRPEDVFQNSAGYGMFTAGLQHWSSMDKELGNVTDRLGNALDHLRKIEENTEHCKKLDDIAEDIRSIKNSGIKMK